MAKMKILRSNDAGKRPTTGSQEIGSVYVNFADGQLGVIDPIQSAQDMIAIRYFSDVGQYLINDFVTEQGKIYKAIAANGPGTFNPSDWTEMDVEAHANDVNNPHSVTKSQVGLGNVDNTSDVDKPISTATQNALNSKADKVNSAVDTELAQLDAGGNLKGSGIFFDDSATDDNHLWSAEKIQTEVDTKEDALGNPTTDGEVVTSLIDGTRSWKKLLGGTNMVVNVDTAGEITFSSVGGTTAGILNRLYITGDTEDLNGTTYYSVKDDKGTVDEAIEQISVSGGTGAPQTEFPTKVLGRVHTEDYTISKGSYNGQLTLETSSNTGDMRFMIKLYKASATDGSYDPVSDLFAEVDTGIIDFRRSDPTQLSFSAPVESDLIITPNDRVVYVVSGGATAGNHTLTWYLGNLHNNYIDVPIKVSSDTVINDSTVVTGATVTDALDSLNSSIPTNIDDLDDVDTTTTTPEVGQAMMWDGSKWIPATLPQSSSLTVQDPIGGADGDNIPIGTMDLPVTFEKIIANTIGCEVSFKIGNLFNNAVTVAANNQKIWTSTSTDPDTKIDNPAVTAGTLIKFLVDTATLDGSITNYINITLVYKIG